MSECDTSSPTELVEYLSGEESNTPAAQAALRLFYYAGRIDPNTPNSRSQALRDLKRLGIRGNRLERLFVQVCHGSFSVILTLLRSESLGFLSAAELNAAIDEGHPLDLRSLLAQVQAQLPDFNKETG